MAIPVYREALLRKFLVAKMPWTPTPSIPAPWRESASFLIVAPKVQLSSFAPTQASQFDFDKTIRIADKIVNLFWSRRAPLGEGQIAVGDARRGVTPSPAKSASTDTDLQRRRDAFIVFAVSHRFIANGDWRMMPPEAQTCGEIVGLPLSRGVIRATDGVMCLIETWQGELFEGHLEWWKADKQPATASKRAEKFTELFA